jgi:anti-anti-sigma regulatory factor
LGIPARAASRRWAFGRFSDIERFSEAIDYYVVVSGLEGTGGAENNHRLEIETQTVEAGTILVRVAGDLCADGAARTRRTLAGELTGSPAFLLLELSEVVSIDAEGVDTLLVAAELTADEDIGLCLVAPAQGAVRAALAAVEASESFEIFASVIEALRNVP